MISLLPHTTIVNLLYGLGAQLTLCILLNILYLLKVRPVTLIVDNILIFTINTRKNYIKHDTCDQLLFFVFMFILTANLISLMGFGSILSHPVVTVIFVVLNFIWMIIIAIQEAGVLRVIKSFAPKKIPALIMPIIYILELVSFLIKPLIFSVRLLLNSSIGHLLLHVIEKIIPNVIAQQVVLSFVKVFEFSMSLLQASIIINNLAYLYSHLIH